MAKPAMVVGELHANNRATPTTAYFGGSVSGLVVSGGAVGVKVVTTVARNRASRAVAKSVDPNTLARTHSIEGKRSSKLVDRISDSMHKDGFIGEPIDVVQHKGKNFIIDGHHRAAAARRTGTQVDINVVDDIAGHRSNFNSLDDVLKSAETVGSNRLRPPRR